MPTSTEIILAREGVYLRDFKKYENSLGAEFTRLLETGNIRRWRMLATQVFALAMGFDACWHACFAMCAKVGVQIGGPVASSR